MNRCADCGGGARFPDAAGRCQACHVLAAMGVQAQEKNARCLCGHGRKGHSHLDALVCHGGRVGSRPCACPSFLAAAT